MRSPALVRKRRGAALMAVLWLIAILSVVCIVTLRLVAFDIDVASATIHGARARQLAEMGVAVGSHPMVKRHDPLLMMQRQSGGVAEGYQVHLTSEGARFNINAIVLRRDTDLLHAIFAHWGLEFQEASALIDALIDWADADDQRALLGAEKEDYDKAGRLNQPFNRPFYDLDEVRLVRGMDRVEALRPDWRRWFTLWSSGQLDLNDADPEFLAVAAECPIEQASLVSEAVCGRDGIRDTQDDVPYQNPAPALELLGINPNLPSGLGDRFTVNDPTVRIESIGQAGAAKRKITVILRNRTGKPALLERLEEIIP